MPQFCSAYSCLNLRTVDVRDRGITFHKFPKDKERRKRWEIALRRDGFTASDSSVLCSKHFKTEDFDKTGQIVRLRADVIPSIFSFPVHLQRVENYRTTITSTKAQSNLQPQSNDDHCYALPASLTAITAKHKRALARVEYLERDKKNTMAREKRAKTTAKSLLGELSEKNLITEELKERLEFYSDLQLEFMEKKGHEYSNEYREFALTLHLHGPKAYKYLGEKRRFPLPHPHTLQRWLCSVDDRPGLNKMMLDMLERKCQEDHAKYGFVALILDAMAIRKHVQYNLHTQSLSGFVDLGDGNNETEVATEALMFMVVGLQAPIAYYLTASLSPDTQKVLVSHALEELHARGIRVLCITMDGHATNISMCNQLGCELKGNPQEPLKTNFPHPVTGEKVFVMMDPCHMLKLTRNMLQAYSPIATTTGHINWKYIYHLNDVQKQHGLHAANKISDKHVYFENHKMRVSLAAQTLSRSVSVALRTMRDLGYSLFKDCEATAAFIEMIDRMFDTMNARNPLAKGFKAPMGSWNWMERKAFLSRAREYLLTLLTKDGTPLHRSKRYLSVIGFVINIDTLLLMIPELLQVQRYVLTYRFSQDHLELLFNSIRASGGWNNNPSACQFQAIFRRLMVRCGVTP
uniref:THAP-type domain-containing protein n=1 Tax=Poecilia formosa TaxID=48698 RepID=A0A096LQR8_POEFO